MGNHLEKIPEEEIKFLSENTIFKRSEIQDFYKDFMKTSSDGLMDFLEFRNFLASLFPNNADSFADHYFRVMDKDESGKIDFKEFILYLSSQGSSYPFERLGWLFDLFDIDGNGKIEKKEMTEIFKIAFRMTKEDTKDEHAAEKITEKLFGSYDMDKNNVLSKGEFTNSFLENPQLFEKFPIMYYSIVSDT